MAKKEKEPPKLCSQCGQDVVTAIPLRLEEYFAGPSRQVCFKAQCANHNCNHIFWFFTWAGGGSKRSENWHYFDLPRQYKTQEWVDRLMTLARKYPNSHTFSYAELESGQTDDVTWRKMADKNVSLKSLLQKIGERDAQAETAQETDGREVEQAVRYPVESVSEDEEILRSMREDG